MAFTTIDNPELYFQTVLYTGNQNTQAITFDGSEDMQPDFVWIKQRADDGYSHELFDVVRGVTKYITSDTNAAEATGSTTLTAFGSDGFTLGADTIVNKNTKTYVAWNWKAGGSSSANSDGTINTTGTSVNQTAGLSISKYTGTGSNATFGHGLGATPRIVLWKRLDNDAGAVNWIVQSPILGNQTKMVLNTTEATSTGSSFSATDDWTSTTIDLKTYEGQNHSSAVYVAYCIAEKQGYSKIGSYTGNGQDTPNGVFVHTGFSPAYILIKALDTNSWVIVDNKRPADSNPVDDSLPANDNADETTGNSDTTFDFLANGFRTNGNSGNNNSSGQKHIFIAFAEAPFVNSNGVPGNAR